MTPLAGLMAVRRAHRGTGWDMGDGNVLFCPL
jgi:hypothetical protein